MVKQKKNQIFKRNVPEAAENEKKNSYKKQVKNENGQTSSSSFSLSENLKI